ncbi:MAG: 2Fe-2S iron-sulfur cluster binding domain-containing protein [Alphaproteobacteria bacterium]|nr:2Fe-2S iron-sulfur cluster binding domain-containing protein [Alphaproteobacteria bacterium]
MYVHLTDMEGNLHKLQATEEWTVMEIIREGGIPILAQCGGSCACATCHVYVDPEWQPKLPAPNEEEIGMLDGAFEVTHDSRLACQIIFTKDLDGLKVKLAPGSI